MFCQHLLPNILSDAEMHSGSALETTTNHCHCLKLKGKKQTESDFEGYFTTCQGLLISPQLVIMVFQRRAHVSPMVKIPCSTAHLVYHIHLKGAYLPSDQGLGPVLWLCPCMTGVGQGLDWGPPICAIGIPFNTITIHALINHQLHFQEQFFDSI